eukprot:131509-Prorocentrum_lima.AAC.1
MSQHVHQDDPVGWDVKGHQQHGARGPPQEQFAGPEAQAGDTVLEVSLWRCTSSAQMGHCSTLCM